jgi:ABC-type nitrate/sulfonate/bicarbonate transport system permease component
MAACHATVATFWGDISNGVLIDRTLTSLRTLAIGYGLGLALVSVIIHSVLWEVSLNTLSGIRNVPETLRMSGRNVGLKGAQCRGLNIRQG